MRHECGVRLKTVQELKNISLSEVYIQKKKNQCFDRNNPYNKEAYVFWIHFDTEFYEVFA